MQTRVATVLLFHDRGPGSHYDWMIEDPAADPGTGRLYTWRVPLPAGRWVSAGRFSLQALWPHRRDYLTYEGPLGGGRGTVRRVDQGWAEVREWAADSASFFAHLKEFHGLIRIRRVAGDQWLAECV